MPEEYLECIDCGGQSFRQEHKTQRIPHFTEPGGKVCGVSTVPGSYRLVLVCVNCNREYECKISPNQSDDKDTTTYCVPEEMLEHQKKIREEKLISVLDRVEQKLDDLSA